MKKSQRKFSAIAIKYAHEQNNAMVKSDGGAAGLTENPRALRRRMVSGPEISRVVNEFEESMKFKTGDELSNAKHGEIQSTQLAFAKDVDALGLGLVPTSVICLLMKSAQASGKRCLTRCHFFTSLQGVILYPTFPDVERRLPGQPGSYSTTQQMFSFR